RPPRRTSVSIGSPSSGKRSESRTAAPTSATGSRGGGGASTTAFSPALTTATFEPARSGILGNEPMQAQEARPEAAARPEPRGEQVGDAPVRDHGRVSTFPRPGEACIGESDAQTAPAHARLGDRKGEQ